MNKHPRCSVPVALLVLNMVAAATTPCFALDSTDNPLLTLTANYNTIQFKLSYEGDDNQNATLLVRYWKTGSPTAIDTAVVPTRDVSVPRFTGVIFWLDEHTGYTVQAQLYDPDGIYPDVIPPIYSYTTSQSITTRDSADPDAGSVIWVGPSGSNSYAGTDSMHPKQTIMGTNGAYNALTGAYRQIRLLPGIYYEFFQPFKNGTANAYYSIVGNGDPDSTIIDGSDQSILNDHAWLAYPDSASQINSIYYRIYPDASTSVTQITAGWGQRLHRKECPQEMITFKRCATTDDPYPHQGYRVSQGLGCNPPGVCDSMFVRLENGANPNATTMHVSIHQTIEIWGAYWAVRNLTARYSTGNGLAFGPSVDGGILRGCRTYNNAQAGVFINNGSDYVLVDACSIWDGRIGTWGYLASKSRLEENAIGLHSHGHNTVVRNCSVDGTSNGITVAANASGDKTWGADSDVHYNKVTNVADDALEFDFNQGVNVAVWGNYIKGCNNGWSQTSSDIGPIYVIYNVFSDYNRWQETTGADEAGIKLGSTGCFQGSSYCWYDSAYVFYYHNAFASSHPSAAAKCTGDPTIQNSGAFKNQTFANNVLLGNVRFIVNNTDNHLHDGCSFDYDLIWRENPDFFPDLIWRWYGNKTCQSLRDDLGFELHGKCAAPGFADRSNGNFRPASGSPQIDMGTRIQGINTPYKTRSNIYMYSGKPDVGPYEYNFSNPAQPPFRLSPGREEPRVEGTPSAIDFALGPPYPNPVLGTTAFQLALPRRTEVDAGVYDVSGRLVRVVAARHTYPAGMNELIWDGRDHNGLVAPTGMYFLRVRAGESRAVRRVMVLH